MRPMWAQTFTVLVTRLFPEHAALSSLISTHFTCSCAIKILLISNWIFTLAMKAGWVNRLVHKFTAVLGTIASKAWLSRICEWSTSSFQLFWLNTSATSSTADSVLDTGWFSVLRLATKKSHTTFNRTINMTTIFLSRGMSFLAIQNVLYFRTWPTDSIDHATTSLYAHFFCGCTTTNHRRSLVSHFRTGWLIRHVHTWSNITSYLRLLSID
jgi:hypothetical protein